MSPVAWGLLGTARINRRLIPAMRVAARSSVVAVASRDAARAEAYAREWDIPLAVHGYDALIARDDVHAVYVPLPNSLHVEWVLKAVAAGKHVLCEKPLALTAADVDRIEAAVTEQGLVVEEAFMYRHEPLTARVTDLVAGGAVGAVRAIVSGFTYAQSRTDDVRLVRALGGGGLFDVGCYPVSYACLLAGGAPLAAMGMARWTAGEVDEEFTGLLRFTGDATATIYAGFRAAYHTWLLVMGSEGTLEVPNPFKPRVLETLRLERLGDQRLIEVPGSEVLFVQQVEHFVERVLDGRPPTVSLAESRRTAAVIAALDAAARRQCEVRL